MQHSLSMIRLRHETAAILANADPLYLLTFERMEVELAAAEARAENDPITQARRRLEARRLSA